MILQALTRYYEDLLSRGEIAAPGWAPAKISLALYINENGELTQIVPTMVEGTKGKKTVMQPQLMVLPAAVKRTVSIASNFLWDNSAYLLGIDQKGKPERSRECFAAAAKLHHAVVRRYRFAQCPRNTGIFRHLGTGTRGRASGAHQAAR